MPNDARLGLVVGVGLVIVCAVLFYRKDTSAQGATPPAAQAATSLPRLAPLPAAELVRRHTVRSGETLGQLAQRYYGDDSRQELIRQANRSVLPTPAEPAVGTVLIIPDDF